MKDESKILENLISTLKYKDICTSWDRCNKTGVCEYNHTPKGCIWYKISDSIKQALVKTTCWNIMVRKNVDLRELRKWIYAESNNVVESAMEIYNQQVAPSEQLTEEEFNVLKEGLE